MLTSPFFKMLSLYLAASVLLLSLPAQGWAMLVPVRNDTRAGDLAKVRTALESSAVKQRLLDFGLTSEEAAQRISMLSDEQLHQFAVNIDAVQAGGDAAGGVIFVLLVVVIVLVILELTGHRVVMKR